MSFYAGKLAYFFTPLSTLMHEAFPKQNLIKTFRMKHSQDKQGSTKKTTAPNKAVIENKDNLDSRKNEEWQTKGDDVTHNEKDTKGDKLKKRN